MSEITINKDIANVDNMVKSSAYLQSAIVSEVDEESTQKNTDLDTKEDTETKHYPLRRRKSFNIISESELVEKTKPRTPKATKTKKVIETKKEYPLRRRSIKTYNVDRLIKDIDESIKENKQGVASKRISETKKEHPLKKKSKSSTDVSAEREQLIDSDDIVLTDDDGDGDEHLSSNPTIAEQNPASTKKYKNVSEKSKAKVDAEKTDGPPKIKRCQAKTVMARLEKIGINPNLVGSCVKSAMGKGHIILTGNCSDLDQLIVEGEHYDHHFKVLLKDILYQPDYGHDYDDGSGDATATCDCCDSDDYPMRAYVTRICEGNAQLDSGKYHNHCTECKGFGKCIGDYREAHCLKCNKHWFTGLSGFPCSCQSQSLFA